MPEQRAEMKSRGRRMDDDDGRIRGSEAGWEGVVQGGETRRLEKRATYNVIEFLLWLISHIHFIMLSWLCARVYCRNFSLISESMSILTD